MLIYFTILHRFSNECRRESSGEIACLSCPVGYLGSRCERCDTQNGYLGDPTVIGGSCRKGGMN